MCAGAELNRYARNFPGLLVKTPQLPGLKFIESDLLKPAGQTMTGGWLLPIAGFKMTGLHRDRCG
jgi:hypothetical protein